MDMQKIMELAGEIGKLVKDSDEVTRYAAATKAYEEDAALNKLIEEFNAQQQALHAEYHKEQPDEALIESVNTRLDGLYNDIMANETYIEYASAKDDYDAIIKGVNDEIVFQITGERPCSHNCSGCSGCH